MTPGNFTKFLPLLSGYGVEYILIGGGAAIAHGAARTTYDVDIVYARHPVNLQRLVNALKEVRPYLRGAPPGLPFVFDERTLSSGLNFTLTTDWGDIDLLGEVIGGGTYEELFPSTRPENLFGVVLRIVTLEALIHLKRSAGRPKDFEAIAELEALREERHWNTTEDTTQLPTDN